MKKLLINKDTIRAILFALMVFIVLSLVSEVYHFLVVALLEFAITFLTLSIFVVTWFTRKYSDNNTVLLIGISFLFVAIFELIAFFAREDLSRVPGIDFNTYEQLWITARLFGGVTFLVAPFFSKKRLDLNRVFIIFGFISILVLLSVYVWNIYPDLFVPGRGPTLFSYILAAFTAGILIASIFTLKSRKSDFDETLYKLLVATPPMRAVSVIVITVNVNEHSLEHLLAVYLLLLSYYIVFIAIVRNGLEKPYDFLFSKLQESFEIRKQRDFLETLIQASPVAIMVLEENMKFVRFNPFLERITGFRESDIKGKKIEILPLPPEEMRKFRFFIQSLPDKREKEGIRTLVITPKGEFRTIEWFATEIMEKKKFHGLLLIGHDITEQTRFIEALRESEEKYRQLFSAELDAVIVYNEETGKISNINESAVLLYGYSREEFLEISMDDIVVESNGYLEGEAEPGNGKPELLEYHRKKNGTVFPAEISHGVFEFRGETLVCRVVRDITENENLKKDLMQKNMELENFAYKVSHDLKSPLGIIRGYLDLLKSEPSKIDLVNEAVSEEFNRIIQFIESILQLSRAGKVIDIKEKINLADVVDTAYRIVETGDVPAKLIKKELPTLRVDPDRMTQVFQNLFNNAVENRNLEQKEVIIEVTADYKPGQCIINVRDNGKGIKTENLERIFEAGFSYKTKGQRGTGFGLAIVKKIIEAHGGTVWVESTGINRGTVFSFNLPC